jgi:hypothetical protein
VKTTCTWPAGWTTVEERPDGAFRVAREGVALEVEVEPLRLPPLDGSHVLAALVGASDPETVRIGTHSEGRTQSGWPYRLTEVAVFDGDHLIEARIVIALEFLQRVTALRIRAREPALLTTFHAELMTILDSAQPDWRDEVPAELSGLWSPPSRAY